MYAADIGAQTQKRELALKWTDSCIQEFHNQALKEVELGLEVTPYMLGLKDDEMKCMQLQHGFISGVVSPLWSSLAEVFPKLSVAVDKLCSNRTYYASRLEELTALNSSTDH